MEIDVHGRAERMSVSQHRCTCLVISLATDIPVTFEVDAKCSRKNLLWFPYQYPITDVISPDLATDANKSTEVCLPCTQVASGPIQKAL
jgi:hypothetical protein